MKTRGARRGVAGAAIVFLSVLMSASAVRAGQGTLPSARDIIARSIDAMGGATAFKALKSMRARGTFTLTAQQIAGSLEVVSGRPNKLVSKISIAGLGQVEEGYDGKIGWSIDPMSGPALVTGRQLIERADESWFDAPLHEPDYVKDMTVVGREAFDGRDAYRLKVVTISGVEQFEFYEVSTGLFIGVEASRATPMGVVPTTGIFRDFQKFGGFTFPATLIQRALGLEQVLTFSSYEFDAVPASAFEPPAVIKALIK
jgi:hypothetical protein